MVIPPVATTASPSPTSSYVGTEALFWAPHPPSGFGAQNNASVPTYELVGEGDAVVATGGMTIAGRWRKAASDAPMLLFGADGQPLALAPGNTWVELVPAGQGSVAIGGGGAPQRPARGRGGGAPQPMVSEP